MGPVGALNGYVAIPPEHPHYMQDYNNIEDIEVHGGLTYSGPAPDNVGKLTKEQRRLWWLGFDTAHAQDKDHPKDEAYVTVECCRLARQLFELMPEAAQLENMPKVVKDPKPRPDYYEELT